MKIIYTTNVIESLNSQFRKVTKTKLIFPNDESLLKMLYLATEKIHLKWTRNYPDWDLVINQLKIVFSDVFSKDA
jgi:putative transposase